MEACGAAETIGNFDRTELRIMDVLWLKGSAQSASA